MSKKFVRREVDLGRLPPLTEKQEAELAALAARPDSDIDYGEIPPLTAKFWSDAARGRFYKPIKTSTTVRIDADVLAWLRAQGKGYQSRINAILRREMLSSVEGQVGGRFLEQSHGGIGEPGLDRRHRDKSGEIRRKHGNTHLGTLRKHYGVGFAPGFKDTDTLAHVLAALDEPSLTKLIKDYEGGKLDEVVAAAPPARTGRAAAIRRRSLG
jgi:uncharacterized protein (DUF4415 family)